MKAGVRKNSILKLLLGKRFPILVLCLFGLLVQGCVTKIIASFEDNTQEYVNEGLKSLIPLNSAIDFLNQKSHDPYPNNYFKRCRFNLNEKKISGFSGSIKIENGFDFSVIEVTGESKVIGLKYNNEFLCYVGRFQQRSEIVNIVSALLSLGGNGVAWR